MQDDVQEADSGHDYSDLYTGIATDCYRYLGLSLEQINRLTIPEYRLLMHAYNLKQVDRADELHLQAWLTVAAGATKKNGQPAYKKYAQFFDRETEEQRITEKPKENKFSALSKHLKDKHNGNK